MGNRSTQLSWRGSERGVRVMRVMLELDPRETIMNNIIIKYKNIFKRAFTCGEIERK